MRFLSTTTLFCLISLFASAQPIRLLPQNPHYFEYAGKPTVIIGSGEHYGGVINLDFDYKTYLNTLHTDGLNTTRLFTGAYVEKLGDFGIQKNTLAPQAGRLVLPWARSAEPETSDRGYALGGNKFDLTKWDDAYFARLRDFMTEAQRQDIIVEITLFSSYYTTGWPYSVFKQTNNVNQTDDIRQSQVNTLQNGNVLRHQEAYVRKLVRELNGFPNLYFELQNEPWADLKDTVLVRNEYHTGADGKPDFRATLEVVSQAANDWQRRVSSWIVDEEKRLSNKHLISQNISNFRYPVVNPDPNVSIVNFHYAFPEAVSDNYALNKVIGFNETGFAGQADQTYRRQAWRFLMAGGSLFNHLDYSFAVGAERGQDTTYRGGSTPGGGSPTLRKQFSFLKQYVEKLDLTHLRPDKSVVRASPGAVTWAMRNDPGDWIVYPPLSALSPAERKAIRRNRSNGRVIREWVIYAEPLATQPFMLQLILPDTNFRAEWTDVTTGQIIKTESVASNSSLTAPAGMRDVVVRVTNR